MTAYTAPHPAPPPRPTPARRAARSRARWFVLFGSLALLALVLIVGAKAMIARGEKSLDQPLLTAPPPLTGTPTPLPEPEYGTSAPPLSFPPVVADQQARPSELAGGWKVLPDEPDLFSSKAPVVYSDAGVGTLLVSWHPSPDGDTVFGLPMSWTQNHGTVTCGRSRTDDVLMCGFATADGGSVTVEGRGTTVDPLVRATQDLQEQLPPGQ